MTIQNLDFGTSAANDGEFLATAFAKIQANFEDLYAQLGGVTDPELSAIAALTSAANKLPYYTGLGTAALADFTSFGRSLVDDADAAAAFTTLGVSAYAQTLLDDANAGASLTTLGISAFAQTLLDDANAGAAQTTLGLVIGTNVQAYDADLTTWAGLTPSANAQSLVTASDYSAMRTLLGLVIGTNVQAYDAELAAIAGLTSAADRLPYFTGSGTAALATFTSFGRSLVDDADATAAKTTLGLVIGTNVQAYDAELAALAGLTSAADKVPYFTGSGTAAVADFSSFGRSLVDDADASAARTTLGLGTAAVAATGTSGTVLGFLDGANTHSGANIFTQTLQLGNGSASTHTLSTSLSGANDPAIVLRDAGVSIQSIAGTNYHHLSNTRYSITAAGIIQWSSGSDATTGYRLGLTSPASGTLQFYDQSQGASDLAIQTSVSSGSNIAGRPWTIANQTGTGTGTANTMVFRVGEVQASGSTAHVLQTALTLQGPANGMKASVIIGNAAIPTNATDGFLYIPTCAGTPTGVPTTFTGRVAIVYDTTNDQFWIYDGAWMQPKTPAGAAIVTWQ